MNKSAYNPPYVWVIEKKIGAYGCIVRRFAFVQRNRLSVTVLEHGIKRQIFDNATITFVYSEDQVKPAVVGHMRNQLARLKKDMAKLEAAIETPEIVIREIDDKPHQVPEGPLQLD